jgi:hypothetical protein
MNFANAAIRAHWARRATYHVTAARSHLYLLAGTWEPERDLPEEHRLIITPQEFRSSPNVILVDPRLLRVIDDRTEQLLSLMPGSSRCSWPSYSNGWATASTSVGRS